MPANLETRKRLLAELTPILKTGDMILRFGDAKHFVPIIGKFGLQIDFSRWLQDLYRSPWSHAAVVIVDELHGPEVVDMSNEGLRRFQLQDWLMECHDGGAVLARRPNPEWRVFLEPLEAKVRAERLLQPEYDFLFKAGDNRWYCTEFTRHIYADCGLPLDQPSRLMDAPGWGIKFKIITKTQGVTGETRVVAPSDLALDKCFYDLYSYLPVEARYVPSDEETS